MKIKLGDFYPRPEWGWPAEPARRCHILGSRVVEIQGGLGIAALAAKHGDATSIGEGLSRAEHAAGELVKGLPEQKAISNAIKNRTKMLETLVEPYRYDRAKMPKKVVQAIEEQLKGLGMYELKLEGESIKACGGTPSGAHSHYKDEKLELSDLPKGMIAAAKKLRAEQEKKTVLRAKRSYRGLVSKMQKKIKAAKGKK
jgi:hypothetical protein